MSVRPRIFIVDDDEAVRDAIGLLVESCGWEPHACASAAEFMDLTIAAGDQACLVLDLNMPDMDGAELVERLAAERRWLPVIVVTGFVEGPLAARARRAGVRAVLKKPFSDILLLGHIRQALSLA